MPSPLGHALGGAAAGWAVCAAAGPRAARDPWRAGLLFATLGMTPDVDLLVGLHRGPTHSLSAALIVGLTACLLTRGGLVALAAAAAYGSHTLLDWLATDTSAPIGIMALWPVTSDYYQSRLHLFGAISRRYWLAGFWGHNAKAVAREIALLGPPALLMLLALRRRRPSPGDTATQ